MSFQQQVIIAFGGIVTLSLILGMFGRASKNTLTGFFWGDGTIKRNRVIDLLLSSPFSMNGLLYQTWLGYVAGYWAILIQVVWCASYILLAIYHRRLSSLVHQNTLHGNIGTIFGARAAKVAALASVIGFTLQVGWELIVGSSIFKPFGFDNSAQQFVIIVGLSIVGAIYTTVGGLKGNATVNAFQNRFAGASLWMVIAYLMLWGLPVVSTTGAGPWDGGSFARLATELGVVGLVTNTIFSLVWQFVDMSTWQSLAGGDKSESKGALLGASFWVFVFPGVVGTLVGMYLRHVPGLTPDSILSYLLMGLNSSPILVIVVAAGFVAAMLSTIDGLLLAATQAVTWDIVHRSTVTRILEARSDPNSEINASVTRDNETKKLLMQERDIMEYSRRWIVFLALLGGGAVYYITSSFSISIFDLVYIVVSAQMVLFPCILVVLIGKTQPMKFGFLSILLGLISGAGSVIILLVGGKLGWISDVSKLLPWTPLLALTVASVALLPGIFTQIKR